MAAKNKVTIVKEDFESIFYGPLTDVKVIVNDKNVVDYTGRDGEVAIEFATKIALALGAEVIIEKIQEEKKKKKNSASNSTA